MRRILIAALVMALAAAGTAAAAAVSRSSYSGTTAQGHAVALKLRTEGVSKRITSFRIAWSAPCGGTGFTYHGSARLTGIDVVGTRFSGRTRSEAPAGAGRVAHMRLYVRGRFGRGGKVSGHWRGPTRITTLRGRTLMSCHSGVIAYSAERQ